MSPGQFGIVRVTAPLAGPARGSFLVEDVAAANARTLGTVEAAALLLTSLWEVHGDGRGLHLAQAVV